MTTKQRRRPSEQASKGDGGATRILHKRREGTSESVKVEATAEHYLDGTRKGSRGAIRARKGAWRWPERPERSGGNLPLMNAGRWQSPRRWRRASSRWGMEERRGITGANGIKSPANSFALGTASMESGRRFMPDRDGDGEARMCGVCGAERRNGPGEAVSSKRGLRGGVPRRKGRTARSRSGGKDLSHAGNSHFVLMPLHNSPPTIGSRPNKWLIKGRHFVEFIAHDRPSAILLKNKRPKPRSHLCRANHERENESRDQASINSVSFSPQNVRRRQDVGVVLSVEKRHRARYRVVELAYRGLV